MIIIYAGNKFVLRSHFSLEKWHHVTSAFTLLPYFCVFFVWLLVLVEQLQETLKPLNIYIFKKPVYWFFKSFLSKSWIHMELFGNFFAATTLPPNGIDQRLLTLFFATVPMLRICSLLSYKLGQGQKQVSHPIADCATCLLSLVLQPGVQKATKAKGPEHHAGMVLILNCSRHQVLW